MPTPTIIKVSKVCNIPIDKVEKMWARSKHQSSSIEDTSRYAVAMGLFKRSLPASCLKKLKWSVENNK